MKTYYCVTSSFDDRGKVTAAITDTRDASEKPKSTFKETRHADIYFDWFDNYEKAIEHVAETKNA